MADVRPFPHSFKIALCTVLLTLVSTSLFGWMADLADLYAYGVGIPGGFVACLAVGYFLARKQGGLMPRGKRIATVLWYSPFSASLGSYLVTLSQMTGPEVSAEWLSAVTFGGFGLCAGVSYLGYWLGETWTLRHASAGKQVGKRDALKRFGVPDPYQARLKK